MTHLTNLCHGAHPGPKSIAEAPEETLSYCTCAQEAVSTKRRKKFGSSVAYKTIGSFLSKVRHEDASGLATEQAKFSKGAAARH